MGGTTHTIGAPHLQKEATSFAVEEVVIHVVLVSYLGLAFEGTLRDTGSQVKA